MGGITFTHLSQTDLEFLPVPLQAMFQNLEEESFVRIATRIRRIGALTPTDLHRLNQLSNIGIDTEWFQKELDLIISNSDKEIYTALANSTPFPINPQAQKLIEVLAKSVKDDLIDITKTIGFVNVNGNNAGFAKEYKRIVDKASFEVRSGQLDFNSAMRKSLAQLADNGISSVAYEIGYNRRIDTSVRSAMMGATSRISRELAEINGREFGADGMEISWHGGARDTHVWFAGKQFSMKDYKDKVYEHLQDFNCYHRAFPIMLGISAPTYTQKELNKMNAEEKNTIEYEGNLYNSYDAQQMQRRLETAIRQQKDRAIVFGAGGNKEAEALAKSKANILNARYKNFSEKMDIPVKPDRISIKGYRGGGKR